MYLRNTVCATGNKFRHDNYSLQPSDISLVYFPPQRARAMFSPASTPRTAPRKSIYRPSGSVLRTGTPGTPSLTSERGREREYASQTPTALPRRAALRGASPPRSISGESSRTTGGAAYRYEGLEDGGKTILGKDERMGLFSLGALPNEVNEAVQRAGMSISSTIIDAFSTEVLMIRTAWNAAGGACGYSIGLCVCHNA